MKNPIIEQFFKGLGVNRTENANPGKVVRGDVVCVDIGGVLSEEGILKRYGIWSGKGFIYYGRNSKGVRIVHEATVEDFMQGADHYAVCEFPEKYGPPTEVEYSLPISDVVMPKQSIFKILSKAMKAEKYKRYSHEETAKRAERLIGTDGYLSSEHFAMLCKTGIAESHELEHLRNLIEQVIVY